MASDPPPRPAAVGCLGLAAFGFSPCVLTIVTALSSWGHDLSAPFHVALAGLFVAAALAAAAGEYRGRIRLATAGETCAFLAVVVFLLSFSFRMYTVGYAGVRIDVRVLDADTNEPVSGARLFMSHERNQRDASEARTDGDGRANLTHPFRSSGFQSLTFSRGSVAFWGTTLRVDAAGYVGYQSFLHDHVEPEPALPLAEPPAVLIRLRRVAGPPPE